MVVAFRLISTFFILLIVLQGSALAAKKMPKFSLLSVTDDRFVSSDEFAGKVTLITFFATWCQPCVIEVGSLKRLQSELGGEDFTVLAISVDIGAVDNVKAFVEEKMINYPVVSSTPKIIQDFGGVYSIPTSFLIDKNSRVVKKYASYQPHSVFEKDIKALL